MMRGKGMRIDNFCVPIAKNCSDEYKKNVDISMPGSEKNNKSFINR
jgi:hypothetical protein